MGACSALLLLLLAAQAISGILYAPTFVWNELRLARSMALLRGVSLYPAREGASPIIGTLHTPVSHCLYLAVAWLRSPTALLLAGSTFTLLLVFAPLAWVTWRSTAGAGGRFPALAAFLFAGFLILQTPGPFHVATMIHIDAGVVLFGAIAGGVFANPRRAITVAQVWIAGAACVLATGCKQTAAPIVLAVAAFVAIAAGRKMLAHFCAAVGAAGIALGLAILSCVPARDFLFNTVTLAAHRPLKQYWMEILVVFFRDSKLESLPAIFPLLLLGIFAWGERERGHGIRDYVLANRWLAFVGIALVLWPVTVKAMVTVGSDVNHIGIVEYFVFLAAAMAIAQALVGQGIARRIAWICASAGIAISLAPGALLTLPARIRHVRESAAEAALAYERRHPGHAYFPCSPMAGLLVTGKAYHFDYSVYDRQIGGYPLTDRQFAAGLPPHFEIIAIPPGQAPRSALLFRLLKSCRRVEDPELFGWTVYHLP